MTEMKTNQDAHTHAGLAYVPSAPPDVPEWVQTCIVCMQMGSASR